MTRLPDWIRPIVDFALPPRCPTCGVTVAEDHRFCLPCWEKLRFLGDPACSACGIPFAYDRTEESLCADCLRDPPSYAGVRAVVAYDDHSRAIPMRLKYAGKLGNARLIAQHLVRHLSGVPDDALLIPVPLHRWRLWQRGFNQSQLIASELAGLTGLQADARLLIRKHATPPLRGMAAAQRRRTVARAFALKPDKAERLHGRTIVLIDDVYTSGATADACARQLRDAGAARVVVMCWARVVDEII